MYEERLLSLMVTIYPSSPFIEDVVSDLSEHKCEPKRTPGDGLVRGTLIGVVTICRLSFHFGVSGTMLVPLYEGTGTLEVQEASGDEYPPGTCLGGLAFRGAGGSNC